MGEDDARAAKGDGRCRSPEEAPGPELIELVGQRDDMRTETAAQSGALKAQADASKTQWDSMTPAQKASVRKASWAKKREELSGIEAVGQRDDSYVLPW